MLAVTYSLVLRIRPGFLEGSHSPANCTGLLHQRGNTHVGSNPTPSAKIQHTGMYLIWTIDGSVQYVILLFVLEENNKNTTKLKGTNQWISLIIMLKGWFVPVSGVGRREKLQHQGFLFMKSIAILILTE